MKFAIRDDDISFFTKSDTLENLYSSLWDKLPISLAVVPFFSDKPTGDNGELIEFLTAGIKKGYLNILLHGYSHREKGSLKEFQFDNNLYLKVKKGKDYLERLFDVKINTFVPPNNRLSKAGMKAVVDNGLNIVGTFSYNPFKGERILSPSSLLNIVNKRLFYIVSGVKGVQYPYLLDFGSHRELESYTLTPADSFEVVKFAIDIVYKVDGIFCLAVHHWELSANSELKSLFYKVIDYVLSKPMVRFYPVSVLFKRV